MTLLQLNYFCRAYEAGSVTKAAQELFVTQPTISSAIRELEKEYGCNLLDRNGKGMVLTEMGRIFYQQASLLLNYAEDFSKQMHEAADQTRYVKLGLTRSVGSNVYAEFFAHCVFQYPDMNVVTKPGASVVLFEELRRQHLDLIIVPRQEDEDFSNLEAVELKRTNMLVCMSGHHRLADKKSLTVPMILNEKMVSTINDDNKTKVLNRLFAEYGAVPNIIERYDQLNLAVNMILNDVAIGFFPEEGVMRYNGIVGIPLEEEAEIEVLLVWNKAVKKKPEVRKFIKSIREFYAR